jgi:hypothetical protein
VGSNVDLSVGIKEGYERDGFFVIVAEGDIM